MRRATVAPIPPPIPTPTTMSRKLQRLGTCSSSVVATAMAMPIMPY